MNYLTNCTLSTADLINAMVEGATMIKFKELLNHVTQKQLDKVFPFYEGCIPLSLETDYSVAFYKGKYDGKECVYVEHSRIEYIFTD